MSISLNKKGTFYLYSLNKKSAKKRGVSEKLIDSQKEVSQQAGQIQIQVKSDPVGSHRGLSTYYVIRDRGALPDLLQYYMGWGSKFITITIFQH